jgi:hypothetical protein
MRSQKIRLSDPTKWTNTNLERRVDNMHIERVPEQPYAPYRLRRIEEPSGTGQRQRPIMAEKSRVTDHAHTSPLSRIVSREMARIRNGDCTQSNPLLNSARRERLSKETASPLPDYVVDVIYARMAGVFSPE